ncbi:type IV pilus modification protein PilV [Acidovorax sp. FG27]|uniref:type IV pilus modification protein PilV n=1 Tax=Acidovorax sp. FG27 TaxID=3133652 RepID=UPI00333E8B47
MLIRTARGQAGMTLIESLIAIVVMALGILGIVGIQMRTLVETQTSNSRAQAIRLIDNLSERVRLNPSASTASVNANYITAFGDTPASTSCATGCTAANLAAYDRGAWKRLVQSTLPLGDAAVFFAADETDTGNRRQLGVMVSWRENEKVRATDSAADTAAYKQPFTVTGASNVSCPANRICHLQYIPLANRCLPYLLSGSADPNFFCPQ